MKLPKQLFVKIDGNNGEEYFSPAEEAEHLVEMGQTVRIGRYELVEMSDVIGVAQVVPPKPSRRRS